ncbi:MAG: CvpA family protein [Buchnera aphidicola (Macrosiphum albifrons)]|uniref:CvpA family protein n=1 Tax=Buchnera aphidicola (Macrosiphum albifrons) TaxID=2994844 RepID=A0AAJ5PTW6_9GAMM|nr:MAG: CvpA family protein [Buchnera aphidicola (Macrosiphum albifrons)]
MKKIIKKIKFSYYNIILGGLFGLFRSILLIFLFLLIFNYFNQNSYIYYIDHSMLISIFLKSKKYFLLLLSLF